MSDLSKIKAHLDQHHDWPGVYMFKFILLNDEDKVKELLALFSDTAVIQRKFSKGGKYVSFTVKEVMVSAQAVLDRYAQVQEIEGVITL